VYRPTPLPPTTPPTPNGVFFHTFTTQGVRSFDGNGNGTMKGRSVDIFPSGSNADPRIGASDVFFKFTYSVDSDGGLTTQLVPGSYVGTTVDINGNPTAETWTIDKLSLFGLIGQNNSTLTLTSVLPEVQTQTFLTGPRAGQVRYRICNRSRTLIWMGN
jgi:hypothetical protein